MMTSSSQGGHSARVNMRLLVNGTSMSVAQMGPDFLLVDAPIAHPAGEASLVLQVDQSERQWKIRLPDGVSSKSGRVAIAGSQ
jgi:hypothetical protein